MTVLVVLHYNPPSLRMYLKVTNRSQENAAELETMRPRDLNTTLPSFCRKTFTNNSAHQLQRCCQQAVCRCAEQAVIETMRHTLFADTGHGSSAYNHLDPPPLSTNVSSNVQMLRVPIAVVPYSCARFEQLGDAVILQSDTSGHEAVHKQPLKAHIGTRALGQTENCELHKMSTRRSIRPFSIYHVLICKVICQLGDGETDPSSWSRMIRAHSIALQSFSGRMRN
eukprot:TRINITY_DN5043_c0_g1_i1.p1 TRINITY_DN5043_c0_g1~~TRINITY_DN5043_c0_g1_i1.p1  ORF type:complete len:225 (+),score=20.30 TRINITY_DN5043_c0_g1_i1:102-776(+)